jgi:hypothetical protein
MIDGDFGLVMLLESLLLLRRNLFMLIVRRDGALAFFLGILGDCVRIGSGGGL